MEWRLFAIFLSNFLCCLTYDVIAPFYPTEAQHVGISNFETGLVFTFMPLAGFLAAPVVGSVLYKLGRRWTFTAGTVIMGVSMAFMGLADNFSSVWFFLLSLLARALSGVGTACVYTVSNAYIASDYPERMNELLAFTETFSGFGIVVGPVVGAGLYVLSGFVGVFMGLASVYVVGSIWIHYLLDEDKPYIIHSQEENDISHLICHPAVSINCLPIIFSMIAIGFCDTVMGPHLESYGLSSLQVGLLWAVADSGYLLVSCIMAKMLDYVNLKYMNLLGVILMVAGYFMLGPWDAIFPRQVEIVVAGLTAMSLAVALHYICALPNFIQIAQEDLGLVQDDILIDSLSALLTSSTCFGEMLGPVAAGFVVDMTNFDDASVYFGTASGLILVIYLAYLLVFGARRSTPKSCTDSLLTAD